MQRDRYQAVVIGGGVVGASVLYHLAKLGWPDVVLIERAELTAGSTWHAAADFHTLNADPNIATLQKYTIDLYHELERETGLSCGIRVTGGVNFAATPERWEWLQARTAQLATLGIDTTHLISAKEIAEYCPLLDPTGITGGSFDSNEGFIDPSSLVNALTTAAKNRGAEVVLRNRVLELHPRVDGGWDVVTEKGTVAADHVVNAGGLWARKVGAMAGVDLPVTPLEHHYLVTEPLPEVAALTRDFPTMVDLDGFSYVRREGDGLLLGMYEQDPKHWHPEGAPWDFGTNLLPPDLDRIEPELMLGISRYPCLGTAGIRRWVNGPFTFTPDGNPIVGPVPGLRGFWVACGVMAGFSQGGGVGLALAQWMVDGEPGTDIFGMDVARYGPFASAPKYLAESTRQFYSRRFVMTYPNEQLPAARPLNVSPLYDQLSEQGAQWMVSWGLEMPRYFTPGEPDFVETPTLRRSNAFDVVGRECVATREAVGLLDITSFARYEVKGPAARAFLDQLLACKIPAPGQVRLAPMLAPSGRLMGDLTVTCWAEDEFWLMGSYYLRAWHQRWFADQRAALGFDTGVEIRDLTHIWSGVSLAGPRSRDLLARVTSADVSGESLRLMRATQLDVGLDVGRVARLSLTGELGYEINVPASGLRSLYRLLREAGEDLGAFPLGFDSLVSLRLEKSYGIWSKEFTWGYTAGMSGLDAFIDFAKPSFVGRDAALAERDAGAASQLVTLRIDSTDAEAAPMDPVWIGERRVGFVTSAGYGHTLGMSLAMAYLDSDVAADGTAVEVHVLGTRTPAEVIPRSPFDPTGSRMRA